jgi:hypothetical protein
MTWIGEVTHIAWKDVRQQRWVMLAYVALVLLATIRGAWFAQPGHSSQILSGTMLVVVIFGCMLGAVIMQGDSPMRADAFWMSRPFRPSAVLGAKLLVVAGLVLGIPLLGEAIGLAAFGVPLRQLPSPLVTCAAIFGVWLLLAVLLGSLTSDLRSAVVAFLLVMIAIGIATAIMASRVGDVSFGITGVSPIVVGILVIALGLGTLWLLYRRRGARLIGWGGAMLTTGAALLTLFLSASGPAEKAAAARSVGPLSLTIERPDSLGLRDQLDFAVSAPSAPESLTAVFHVSRVTLELNDASSVQLSPQYISVPLHNGLLPVGEQVHWLRDNLGSTTRFSARLTAEDRRALASGVRAIELGGIIVTLRPQLLGTMAVESGAQLSTMGGRTRITRVDLFPRNLHLSVESFAVEGPWNRYAASYLGSERMSFALVNSRAHEALPMVTKGTSSGSDWLVLPGTPVTSSSVQLQSLSGGFPADQVSPAAEWYRDARLAVVQWVAAGTYSTSARARLN